MSRQGNLSINSENIFPVIKKWLYSDHDIFLRELVSNGCDAITKLKKLSLMGEYEPAEDMKYKIQITVNPEEKTISIEDNGLGMTEDEVDEYINQIAFSGAQDFLTKYKDKTTDDQIIGHFGLGFYSAFMVADRVTIDTLSYQDGAQAVHWESEGGTEYEMTNSDKASVGTLITLYLNDDSGEFSNEYRAREVLNKYCSFMPVEIYLADETKVDDEEEVVVEENGEAQEAEKPAPTPINDISPLWNKHPNECTKDEYLDFYRKVFMDFKEPLFWIHLNMDYPFNLKGILYFPKINNEYDSLEGTIKLYNNQVFIADNIKEVIPEFLMLLKGAIDCPDLPLNVSRSALQNDGFVKKISDYITKKVADKLTGMFKTAREDYEKYWDDLSPFIKFGYLKDAKFEGKMKDALLYKNLEDKYLTLEDVLKANEANHKDTVFYVTDVEAQGQYIHMFKEAGMDAVILDHNIDTPFIQKVEMDHSPVKFQRIDADLSEVFKEDSDEELLKNAGEKLTSLFRKELSIDNLDVKVEKLKNEKVASMITMSEQGRRMQEMMKMYSMYGMDPAMFGPGEGETLILNLNHPLVSYLEAHEDSAYQQDICKQLYDLALLSHGTLSAERMTAFIERSNSLMMNLMK